MFSACHPVADPDRGPHPTFRQQYGDLAAAATFRASFAAAALSTQACKDLAVVTLEGSFSLFERFAEAMHELGLAAEQFGSVRACGALKRHLADVGWWMECRPQALVRFVRCCHEGLLAAEACGVPYLARVWRTRCCWRRSVAQMLLDLRCGGESGVQDRIARECAAMDATIRGLHRRHPSALGLAPGPGRGCGKEGGGGGGGATLCDVEEAAAVLGPKGGGLLACRPRAQPPARHWWAWLPEEGL